MKAKDVCDKVKAGDCIQRINKDAESWENTKQEIYEKGNN